MKCEICNRPDTTKAIINGVEFWLCYSHDIPEVYNHLRDTRFGKVKQIDLTYDKLRTKPRVF
mgnify:CR=1 FL=1